MTFAAQENPELAETLELIINYKLSDLFVALPGKVVSYDSSTQKANIKPLLQKNFLTISGDTKSINIPTLYNVPIIFPRGGGYFVSFPLKENDKVLIIFNDRSIDQYVSKTQNEPVDPVHMESHRLNGAIAIPGFYKDSEPLSTKDASATDMIIGKQNGKSRIVINDDEMRMENNYSATHPAVLGDVLETFWNNFRTFFNTHIHPTGMGPSKEPIAPAPAFDINIKSTRVKLPDN